MEKKISFIICATWVVHKWLFFHMMVLIHKNCPNWTKYVFHMYNICIPSKFESLNCFTYYIYTQWTTIRMIMILWISMGVVAVNASINCDIIIVVNLHVFNFMLVYGSWTFSLNEFSSRGANFFVWTNLNGHVSLTFILILFNNCADVYSAVSMKNLYSKDNINIDT